MTAPVVLPPCTVPATGVADTGAQWQQLHPSWLYHAISSGSIFAHDGAGADAYPIEVHALGTIPIPDSRLIACDPYLITPDQLPFRQTIPAGDHEVLAAVATIGPRHQRVAAGILVSGAGPVTRWELGRTNEEPAPDEVGAYLGYGVDAGTGCFLSPVALPALDEVLTADEGMLEDPVTQAMDLSPIECAVASPRDGAPAVAVFHSGWGDGVYPTWFGIDDAGTVVLAMTDFLLFADPWQPASDEPDVEPAPEVAAQYAAPVPEPEPDDIYGGVTAEQAAELLAARDRPRRPGFWARLLGRG